MKILSNNKLGGLLALMLALPLVIPGTAHAQLNDGLAGYWTFDEGLGGIANDVSGNNNNGAISAGGVSYVSPGKVGTSALSFDGTGDVSVPDSASLDITGDFTVSAWIKPDAASLSSPVAILSKYSYNLRLSNGHVLARYRYRPTGSPSTTPSTSVNLTGATLLTAGVWTHIAMTRTGGTLKVFVNGAQDGSTVVTTDPVIVKTTTGVVYPVTIGIDSYGNAPFIGSIDDVKVYNRGLANCEVARLAGDTGQCLVPAIKSTTSPSAQYGMIDPELQQDIVVDNQQTPGNGAVGIAWLPNGHMIRRVNNQVVEYTSDQTTRNIHGTPVYDILATHTVSGIGGTGHGITMGLDGYLYANSDAGLYRIDVSTWKATLISGTYGNYYGIGTLPDGNIVNQCGGGYDVCLYNTTTGNESYTYIGMFVDGLTTTTDGHIALALRYNQGVEILDSNLGYVNTVHVGGVTGGAQPDGMAFGNGSLYTANTDGSISRIDFSGSNYGGTGTETFVASNGAYGDLAGVGPDGAFYITTNGLNYDDGTFVSGWGVVRIAKPGGFSTPPGVPVNKPPTAKAGGPYTAECTGNSSADVTLDASGSSDPDGDPLTYSWTWAGGSATGVSAVASFPMGTTDVTLTVSDDHGHSVTTSTTVTVSDNTPPTVSAGLDATVEATGPDGAAFDVAAQVTASDTCCLSGTSISPAGPYPLGSTTVTVTATDCSNNSASDTMVVKVQDTTAPKVTAQLVPIPTGHGESDEHRDEGLFQVVFSATDYPLATPVDPNPVITATLNGATVTNGQIVKLERGRHAKVESDDGMLEIKGLSFTLNVSATDFSGNTGTASASYAFPVHHEEHEDNGIHRGNDKEDHHVDEGKHKSEGKSKIEHKKGKHD